jgi:hypothetical protein
MIRKRIKAHRRVRAGDLVPHEFNYRFPPRQPETCRPRPIPNETMMSINMLQQTAHANTGFSACGGHSRVRPLLSVTLDAY